MRHALRSRFFLLSAAVAATALITAPAGAQTPAASWQWAAAGGSADYDDASAVAVDAAGNTYVTGYFEGSTAQFGAASLTSQGGSDVFVAKYGPTGALLWLRGGGGNDFDAGTAIAVDAAGNCYVSVSIGGSAQATFDGQTVTPAGPDGSAVLLRYDAAGTLSWLRAPIAAQSPVGSGGSSSGAGLAFDANNNLYWAGSFDGHIAFSTAQLHSVGTSDAFVVSFDVSGAPRWARQFGGAGTDEAAYVGVSATGDYYVAGGFNNSLTIGNTTLTGSGAKDAYVARFSASGTPQWVRAITGTSAAETLPYGLAVAPSGECYVVGETDASTLTIGTTSLANTSLGYFGYLTAYDAAGAVRWVRGAGSNQNSGTYGVALGAGAVHITGGFSGTLELADGIAPTPATLTASGFADVFVARYRTTTGELVGTGQAGGTRPNNDVGIGQGIAVDATGASHVIGYLGGATGNGSVRFGTQPALTSRGGGEVFTASLGPTPVMGRADEVALDDAFRVYPTHVAPAERLTIAGLAADAPARLTLLDGLGRAVQTTTVMPEGDAAGWAPPAVPAGLYVLRAEQGGAVRTRRVVVQ